MSDNRVPGRPRIKSRFRIEIKVSGDQKDLIVRGASAVRKGISEFVREAAEEAALRAIQRNT